MATSMVSTEDVPNSTWTNDTTTSTGDGRNFRYEGGNHEMLLFLGCVYCVVAVSGLVGNTMVIMAVVLSKKLQSSTNAFVVNLATADLISCLTTPFAAVALFSMNGWPLPELVCSVSAAIYYISLGCSILNLTSIAINRYVLITKSIQTYQSIYTPKKIAAMLVFTWLYPASICSLPLFGIGKWGYSEKYSTCTQDTSVETSNLFSTLGSNLIFPMALIILFVCYFKIYRHVTGHMKKMTRRGIEMQDFPTASNSSTKPLREISKRQVEITKNLFYVLCAFLVCLAPFAINLWMESEDFQLPWHSTLVVFNSAVNPIIYGVKHPHFKEVFRQMFRCRYHMIPEPSSCLRKMTST
ncbi:melatonin receptor type 1B-A-like [Asterias rubens]|uniref:melatonin receptor type 1B-A-like n=1 Tax=Asterias rubens TaxID=7604 RepID=UPI001455BA68|nr:melatonin receptor type 1B-A-like [Asterias rubens]